MTNSEFKKGINSELVIARITNKVIRVLENKKTLHTTMVFGKTLTAGQKQFMAVRFQNAEIKDNLVILKHPIEI